MAFTHSLLLGFAFCDRSDFILTGRFGLGSTFGVIKLAVRLEALHQVGGLVLVHMGNAKASRSFLPEFNGLFGTFV